MPPETASHRHGPQARQIGPTTPYHPAEVLPVFLRRLSTITSHVPNRHNIIAQLAKSAQVRTRDYPPRFKARAKYQAFRNIQDYRRRTDIVQQSRTIPVEAAKTQNTIDTASTGNGQTPTAHRGGAKSLAILERLERDNSHEKRNIKRQESPRSTARENTFDFIGSTDKANINDPARLSTLGGKTDVTNERRSG